MTSPKQARTKGGKRTYSWRGDGFHSVTTIEDALRARGLEGWNRKFTAEFAVANYEKLGEMLKPEHDGTVDLEGAVDWLKGAPFRSSKKAADLGTAVHDAVEAYSLGKPFPKWSDAVAYRMENFKSFLARYEPVYTEGMTEATVYNRTQKYAGTLDAIVHIDGVPLILDIKTGDGTIYPITGKSRHSVYPEVALQLAAYAHAEFIGAPDGSEQPMPKVDGAVCLHLPADEDWTLIDVDISEWVFQTFLFIREAFRWREVTSKSVLRGEYKRSTDEAQLALREELMSS